MERTNNQLIETLIPVGVENAIHQNELARRLGVSTTTLKAMIRHARQQGTPIISGKNGYWISDNDDEKQHFINTMRRQGISRIGSANSMQDTLNTYSGQISLFEMGVTTSQNGGADGQEKQKDN